MNVLSSISLCVYVIYIFFFREIKNKKNHYSSPAKIRP